MQLIFEISKHGSATRMLPELEEGITKIDLAKSQLKDFVQHKDAGDENNRNSSDSPDLPEVPENEIIRHYVALSRRNIGIDTAFYPLGSCTMKYNPKINEDIARLEGFSQLHPMQIFIDQHTPQDHVQGALQLIYELEQDLCEITGMDAAILQPAAGAHGELTGLMVAKKYFHDRKEFQRRKVLVPDSAHGTNPASAAICNFEIVTIKSNEHGLVDIEDLRKNLNEQAAVFMITNPNTLGLFETNIVEICNLVHDAGALVYCDGANMNALVGIAKPGEMGFDMMHLNLHKTFSTPHGGGGPGAGPCLVKENLKNCLPMPRITREDTGELDYDSSTDGTPTKKYRYKVIYTPYDPNLAAHSSSIGRVRAFFGNFGILVRAYTYIKAHGAAGLRKNTEYAVLSANYLRAILQEYYDLPHKVICKHEFVLSDKDMPNGVTTNNIAKRLLDYGQHAPTIYFPMIVHGAIMIEPTETESLERLNEFANAMIKIKEEAVSDPDLVKNAPHTTVVGRLDAVAAARKPNVKWKRE